MYILDVQPNDLKDLYLTHLPFVYSVLATFNLGKFCVCYLRVIISLLLFKLESKVNVIRAVGTDGEKVLVNALVAVFPGGSIHLRYFFT